MPVTDQELERKAVSWPETAKALRIVDQETYDRAAFLLKDLAALEGEIKNHHAPIKKAAFEAHKTAVAAEKKLLEPIEQARQIIVRSIVTWDAEQQHIRMEMELKARAEAAKIEEQIRLKTAIAAEEAGAGAEVTDEILSTPIDIRPPVIAHTYQKQSGISSRQQWKAEVTDLKALCLAVGQGKCSENLVMANMAALNAMARIEKSTLRVPGVRAVMDTGIAVRTK